MTKIVEKETGGDSPKSRLLRDLIAAFARADVSRIAGLVTEDVHWLRPGRRPVTGAAAFCKAICRYGPATRLEIAHVITHGRQGAVDGVVEFADKRRAFCYVFEFASVAPSRVSRMTAYDIPLV